MISDLGLAPDGLPPTESVLQEARGGAAPYLLKTHDLPRRWRRCSRPLPDVDA